jgi:hypothetical protein
VPAQGTGGVHLEQVLGREISAGTHAGVDFVDNAAGGLGNISLKGPIPPQGSVEGLAKAVIKDVATNTATKTMVVDVSGLTNAQVQALQKAVAEGTANSSKKIIFIRGGGGGK